MSSDARRRCCDVIWASGDGRSAEKPGVRSRVSIDKDVCTRMYEQPKESLLIDLVSDWSTAELMDIDTESGDEHASLTHRGHLDRCEISCVGSCAMLSDGIIEASARGRARPEDAAGGDADRRKSHNDGRWCGREPRRCASQRSRERCNGLGRWLMECKADGDWARRCSRGLRCADSVGLRGCVPERRIVSRKRLRGTRGPR